MPQVLRIIANLFNVLGALMFWAGCIWILQGVGLLPGSFMSGQIKWAAIGSVMVIVGVAIVWFTDRQRAKA